MKKLLYSGSTIRRIMWVRKFSELVDERIGEANFLMREIYHHPYGVTLRFDYHQDPNNDESMTKLTAFGEEDKLSQMEKAFNPYPEKPRELEFSKDGGMDAAGHKVPVATESEQSLPMCTTLYTAEGVLGAGEE